MSLFPQLIVASLVPVLLPHSAILLFFILFSFSGLSATTYCRGHLKQALKHEPKTAFSYLGRLLKMGLPEPEFCLENNFSVLELLPFIALTIIDRSCGCSLRHAGLLDFKELIGAVLTTPM